MLVMRGIAKKMPCSGKLEGLNGRSAILPNSCRHELLN